MSEFVNLELYAFDEWFKADYQYEEGKDYEVAFVRNCDVNTKVETREVVSVEGKVPVARDSDTWRHLQQLVDMMNLPRQYRYEK